MVHYLHSHSDLHAKCMCTGNASCLLILPLPHRLFAVTHSFLSCVLDTTQHQFLTPQHLVSQKMCKSQGIEVCRRSRKGRRRRRRRRGRKKRTWRGGRVGTAHANLPSTWLSSEGFGGLGRERGRVIHQQLVSGDGSRRDPWPLWVTLCLVRQLSLHGHRWVDG